MATTDYVTLISSDGFEFVLPRSTACVSGTIRRMLDPSSMFFHPHLFETIRLIQMIGKFSEALTGTCILENITFVPSPLTSSRQQQYLKV